MVQFPIKLLARKVNLFSMLLGTKRYYHTSFQQQGCRTINSQKGLRVWKPKGKNKDLNFGINIWGCLESTPNVERRIRTKESAPKVVWKQYLGFLGISTKWERKIKPWL